MGRAFSGQAGRTGLPMANNALRIVHVHAPVQWHEASYLAPHFLQGVLPFYERNACISWGKIFMMHALHKYPGRASEARRGTVRC